MELRSESFKRITNQELANDFINEAILKIREQVKDNKYTGILKGKNIIFVHMESMQSFLMNLKFNGEEVIL